MKIVIINGSDRKGNTLAAINAFIQRATEKNKIAELRDKYNLHMKVERYRSEDTIPDTDQKYIRN